MSIEDKSRRRRSGRPKFLRLWRIHIVRFAALFCLYLLLAENFDATELIAAAGIALISELTITTLSNHNDVRFHCQPRWLRALLAAPCDIVRDSFLILGNLPIMAAYRQESFGRFQRQKLQGSIAELEMPAWRAFKIAEISVAPNSYVIDIDRPSGRILIHQLVERSGRSKRRRLP